mgnify:CR=1 FL=1
MEINVDKEKKMVDIWLTKAEKNDEKLKESLKRCRCKATGEGNHCLLRFSFPCCIFKAYDVQYYL